MMAAAQQNTPEADRILRHGSADAAGDACLMHRVSGSSLDCLSLTLVDVTPAFTL